GGGSARRVLVPLVPGDETFGELLGCFLGADLVGAFLGGAEGPVHEGVVRRGGVQADAGGDILQAAPGLSGRFGAVSAEEGVQAVEAALDVVLDQAVPDEALGPVLEPVPAPGLVSLLLRGTPGQFLGVFEGVEAVSI